MNTTTFTSNRLYNPSHYPLRSRRGSVHSLDSTNSRTKHLEFYSRAELLELKRRNELMLHHRSVIHTLPDKGAKLKQSIRQIDMLLLNTVDDEITAENTFSDRESALTTKLAGLSVLTPRQEARKRGIALANARAVQQPFICKQRRNSSSIFIRRQNSSFLSSDGSFIGSPSTIATTTSTTTTVDDVLRDTDFQTKVCMMSLDESVKLQENHSRLIEENNKNLLLPPTPPPTATIIDESLCMTMSQMQLDTQQQQQQQQNDQTTTTLKTRPLSKILDDNENNYYNDGEEDNSFMSQDNYFNHYNHHHNNMKKSNPDDYVMTSSDDDYDDDEEDDYSRNYYDNDDD